MFNSVVFLTILAYAIADSSYFGPGLSNQVEKIFFNSNPSSECVDDGKLFKQCFGDKSIPQFADVVGTLTTEWLDSSIFVDETRAASKCIRTPTCNKIKLAKYLMDLIVYRGNKFLAQDSTVSIRMKYWLPHLGAQW
ncbi:DUF19 domain-containing protein [Caenorhabditis elegans]|uniref:DUF19 domain-containing protein n=1 Tax=Caenorhabditis elegans TaxID=6239 RepID=Q18555_CAEEL|nr:DUF19 domain-containing protein [Caenorhabditis elegans]CAA94205.2 DUF19 domain-containing protein [Caenorhabditis elegans]|eukprot:NP_001355361.1 Uncharacterized protein CELE_C40C9.3 [Caenorhabditis elegans]